MRRAVAWLLLVLVTAFGLAAVSGPDVAGAAPAAAPSASTGEATMGYDNQRTNWDGAEPGLSPTSVKASDFGQIFNTKLPGTTTATPNQIYAQPIVADGLVIVATEDDEVAALTPAGAVKWHVSLGTPWTPANCSNLVPHVGITGTPVYDPATDAVYLGAKTAKGASDATFKLHALSAKTGKELDGWPVTIGGKSTNGGETFNATTANQRTALLLMDGSVYLAFASHCDHGPYVGFVIGVDTAGTHRQSIWSSEAGEATEEAGIWQSGGGLVSDGKGQILLATGNGLSPGPGPGHTPPGALAESVVRLQVDGNKNMAATDFFSPTNNAKLDQDDGDLGAGAPIALPDAFGTSTHPHLLLQEGKVGLVRVLDRDDLGGNGQGPGGTDADLSELHLNGLWGRFAAFPSSSGNYAFLLPRNAPLTALGVNADSGGIPRLTVRATSTDKYAFNSGSPIVTSDGTDPSSAVVWVVTCDQGTGAHAYLRAYALPSGSGAWQPLVSYSIGTVAQYIQPATVGGRVYVASRDGRVRAYGRPVASALSGPSTEFGLQPVGQQTEAHNVTITATTSVTITNISTAAPFSGDTGDITLPMKLAKNDTLTVPVRFDPDGPGAVTGLLAVRATTGSIEDEYDLSLHGTGIQDGLSAESPTLDFGEVNENESADLSTTVTNTGDTPATIQSVTDPGAPFTVLSEPVAGDTIAPQQSVTVSVRFSPKTLAQSSDALVVTADTGSTTLQLVGTGFDGQPEATIDNTALHFGNVAPGSSKSLSFTITNTGTATLTLTKAPPPVTPFAAPRIEGRDISPGDSLTVAVTFSPSAAEPANDVYSINAGTGQGAQTVTVDGNDVPWAGKVRAPAGCLAVAGGTQANATAIVTASCNSTRSATAEQFAVDTSTNTLHFTQSASTWCVDIKGAQTAVHTKVQLYTCNQGVAQEWLWRADDSLYNPHSGKCLDVPNQKVGVQVQIYNCNRNDAQYWDLSALQVDRGSIDSELAAVGVLCLDVHHAARANGTAVQIYGCNRGIAQQVTHVGDTLRVLGGCVDIKGAGTTNGRPVQLYHCNGGVAQQWTTQNDGVFYNPHSGKCLDVPGSSTKPGTQLQIYTCNGSTAQSWRLPA